MAQFAEELRTASAGLSLAAVGAALAPVVGPILEVRRLSRLSAEEVEAAVRPREPLQNADGAGLVKLTGEDALLDWPNAMGPGEKPPIIPSDHLTVLPDTLGGSTQRILLFSQPRPRL